MSMRSKCIRNAWLGLLAGPALGLWLGCHTVGTAADETGDVAADTAEEAADAAGTAARGAGDVIHDTAETADDELD